MNRNTITRKIRHFIATHGEFIFDTQYCDAAVLRDRDTHRVVTFTSMRTDSVRVDERDIPSLVPAVMAGQSIRAAVHELQDYRADLIRDEVETDAMLNRIRCYSEALRRNHA